MSNSVILIFVSIDLFRIVFTNGNGVEQIILTSISHLEGIVSFSFNFLHYLTKKMSYFVSSSLSINLMAYILITIIYSQVKADVYTVLSGAVLFGVLLVIFLAVSLISKKWRIRIEQIKAV